MVRSRTWTRRAVRRVKWTAGIATGLLDHTPESAPNLFGLADSRRRFVVMDENVWRHYGDAITALLSRYGIQYNDPPLLIPGGEHAKTRAAVDQVLSAMDSFGVARFGEPPQGWGGGVLHDILGLAAGEFRRGVAFDFFATTLVCAIDSMFALKCAVNQGWKNRAGLYHPARYSWTDPQFFRTLTDDDIREGTAEIIKWAIAGDRRLFRLLEDHASRVVSEKYQGTDRATAAILCRTIAGMMTELSGNPYELVTARPSYLGHGISPALEPRLKHGQAVALDVLLTTMVAWRRGLISPTQRDRIVALIRGVGLQPWDSALEDTSGLLRALGDTALHRGGRQNITAPVGLVARHVTLPLGAKVAYLELTQSDLERARDDLYNHAGQ